MDLSTDEGFNPASLPPGYRFCPKDEELVVQYLRRKIHNQPLPPITISEVNLYAYDPDDLAVLHKPVGDGDKWFYFTPRERRYKNGKRPKRSTEQGYWKATGTDKEIKFEDRTVGFRKALVFYRGSPPTGKKTDWIMHEYRVSDPPQPTRTTQVNHDWLDDCFVLCKVYRKHDTDKGSRRSRDDDGSSSTDGVPRIDQLNNNDVNDQSSVGGEMNSVGDLQDEQMHPQISNARAVFSNGVGTWLTNGDAVDPIQEMMNYKYNPMINQHQPQHPITRMSQFSCVNPEVSVIGGGEGMYPDQKTTTNQFNHHEIVNNHHQCLQNQHQQQLAEFLTGGGGGREIASYHFNAIINNQQGLQNQQQKAQLAEFATVGGGGKHTAQEISSYNLNPITKNHEVIQNQQQQQFMSEFSAVGGGGGGKHTAQEILSYHLNPITKNHQVIQNQQQQQFMSEFSTVGGGGGVGGKYTAQEMTNCHFNPVKNNHQGVENQDQKQLPISQMPQASRPNVVLPHGNIQHCPPASTPAVEPQTNNVRMQSMKFPYFPHPWKYDRS